VRHIRIKALIVVVLGVAFAPIVRHAFLTWDDNYTLSENPLIQHPSLENMMFYWRHGFMDLYVPVTYTVWTVVAFISAAIGRGDPAGSLDPHVFHAASVVVHAINALLVFGLLHWLLKKPWPAAAGALLFALHPMQVETVAWASGMKDLLCGMFSLIAIGQYLRAVQPAEPGEAELSKGRRRLHYILGMAAMLLGMLSKPTAMITPLLALIMDLLVLRRSWRRVMVSIAPYLVLAVPCLIWTKLWQPAGYLRYVPLWQRPLIAADALAFYLAKLVFPSHLAFDYGRAPSVVIEKGWAYFTWLVPAMAAGGLFIFRKRATGLIAGALLLAAGVAPVLGFTSFDFETISTVADHYLYLALLGPALAAAWLLTRLSAQNDVENGGRPSFSTTLPARLSIATWITALALAMLAARSAEQARYWQDSRTFYSHTLEVTPQSWSSWYGLGCLSHVEGRELATRATQEADAGRDSKQDRIAANEKLHEALDYYEQTLRLNPDDVAGRHGYAAILMYFGRSHEAAGAFAQVLRRRDMMPPAAQVQYFQDTDLLGQCLYNSGRPDLAVRAFRAAVRLQPPPPGAVEHLKTMEAILAAASLAPPLPIPGKKPGKARPARTDPILKRRPLFRSSMQLFALCAGSHCPSVFISSRTSFPRSMSRRPALYSLTSYRRSDSNGHRGP
jgi:tetratricopeptide (TPR) repeat protein